MNLKRELGAAKALATNGGEAGFLLLKLKVHTGDPEPEVLAECFAGLLAAAPERSVTFVGEYVDAADEAVAEAAILALGESRKERALRAPERQMAAYRRRRRFGTYCWLRWRARGWRPAIAYLLAIAGEASPETAVQAIEALASYRSSERVRSSLQKVVQERNAATW